MAVRRRPSPSAMEQDVHQTPVESEVRAVDADSAYTTYPPVPGIVLTDADGSAVQARYLRGLPNSVPGGPDIFIAGDTLVDLYVDTYPVFADALAEQLQEGDNPIFRMDGVTIPDGRLIAVCALTRPRERMLAGEGVDLVIAGYMAENELQDWPILRTQPCEVGITVDTTARFTRRTTIQFSWQRANETTA